MGLARQLTFPCGGQIGGQNLQITLKKIGNRLF